MALRSHAAVFKTQAVYAHSVVQFINKVASMLWFLCCVFATFLSSQISDLQVIIQVLHSSQQCYGYELLSLCVLPYVCLIQVLACFCAFWGYDSCSMPTCIWKFAWLALDSCHVCHHGSWDCHWRLGHSNPAWLQSHFPDWSACYKLNAAAESFLNTTVCCADKIASDAQPITWYWSVYWYIMMAAFILNSCIIALCSEDKCQVLCWVVLSDESALVYVTKL